MFCSNCGAKIEEGVKFCSGCGKAAGGVPAESGVPVAPTAQQPVVQQRSLMADEKYCFSCGSVIKKAAEICPKCGVNQDNRNRTIATDVYCKSCGKSIKKEAAMCPFCGVMREGGGESESGGKSKLTALLLLLFTSIGHRFYTGKIGTAILMGLLLVFLLIFYMRFLIILETEQETEFTMLVLALISYLCYMIWWVCDLVNICTGKFKDKQGNLLKKN
jgi:RNA polymerase subunit RPABC4/transcription elongation factor Spt4